MIDDEEAVLAMLGAAIEYCGHAAAAFREPAAAEAALTAGEAPPDVVIVDWTLGGRPALPWIQTWRARLAEARWVVVSGDPAVRAALPEGVEWLGKPFHLADLAALLEAEA